jgi:hypothetical protein
MYYPYQKCFIQRFGFGKQLIGLKSAISSPSRSQQEYSPCPCPSFQATGNSLFSLSSAFFAVVTCRFVLRLRPVIA